MPVFFIRDSLFVPLDKLALIPKWAHEILALNLCSEPSFGEAVDLIRQCRRGTEMSKATARSDLREALRFAQGCADRKWPVTRIGLAPWASESSFRLVFPPLTQLVPDLSTAYSCVHRPTWAHLSLRGSLSHSNHRNPLACVNQA